MPPPTSTRRKMSPPEGAAGGKGRAGGRAGGLAGGGANGLFGPNESRHYS